MSDIMSYKQLSAYVTTLKLQVDQELLEICTIKVGGTPD